MASSRMTSDDYTEGYWERGEQSNYRNYADDPGWNKVLDAVRDYLTGDSIREVACAKGYFVMHARNRGYDAKGIDISKYAIEHPAPGVSPYIEEGNAVNLPWADGEADTLFNFEFMEHIYEDELDAVLNEFERVTTGLIVMKIGFIHEGDHGHNNDHTHYNEQTRPWWEGVFSSCGWTVRRDIEAELDHALAGRDWVGRFFVYEVR